VVQSIRKVEKIKNIIIVGTGNVAYHLAKALTRAGLNVLEVVAHSEKSAARFARDMKLPVVTSVPGILESVDLYILAVNDDQIVHAARSIRAGNSLVVHTSGSVPLSTLNGVSANTGVFYPLQTMTYGMPLDFSNVPICLEANTPENLQDLDELARTLTSQIYTLDSEKRKTVHLAAVFASNFSYHMYTVASRLLESEGISPDILHALILETADKAVKSPPGSRQTGPAIREDHEVIDKHLEMLKQNKLYREIYKLLNESIISHKKDPKNEL